MAQYRVLAGIDYPPNKRAEIGDLISDLPASAIKNLLDIGAIESADKKVETPAPVVKEVEEVTFDSNATDGDADGFVQDGTIHQRPVEETK